MPTSRRQYVLVVLGVAFGIGAVGISHLFVAEAAPRRAVNTDLTTALVRVGLSPESLCAAGVVVSQDVSAVVDAAETYFLAHPTAIATADADYASAKATFDRLERLVKSGLGTQADVTALRQAESALASATSARSNAVDALFNAGIAGLSQARKDLLSRQRTNAASFGVSSAREFLVVSRSQTDWVRLREALANEKISARYEEDPDATDQALLATCRADSSVADARTNLNTKLTSVKDAWLAAASQ